jgi:phosphoglycerate dehydrogenase-like enzyme
VKAVFYGAAARRYAAFAGPGAVVLDEGDDEALRRELADAEAVVCFECPPGTLAQAHRLRLLQLVGTGYDHLDLDALPEGVAVCNVFGHEQAIAEWVLAAMLALSRRLVPVDRSLREGVWEASGSWEGQPYRDFRGRVVGAVGAGHIGVEVARLCRALGARPIGVTRSPRPDSGFEWLGGLDELPRLLAESDFAVVSLPLTDETEGLIGAEELRLLGPRGYLLNVGRGPVVAEQALYEALRDGVIAGAAIDVWYRYPERVDEPTLPASLPFWELDNVLMSPHASAWADSLLEGRGRFIAEQLERLAAGAPLENVIRR